MKPIRNGPFSSLYSQFSARYGSTHGHLLETAAVKVKQMKNSRIKLEGKKHSYILGIQEMIMIIRLNGENVIVNNVKCPFSHIFTLW